MKDRFSNHAKQYATFRPVYPESLYQFIFSHVKETYHAWDAGTGNGQVALRLADTFKLVSATDISQAQLSYAKPKENIQYQLGAERIPSLEDKSVDLITVAQAIHWFDRTAFYKEVNRVLKPQGVLAVWGYSLIQINPVIDLIIQQFYSNTLGGFWDAERKHIDNHYQSIEFPFHEISTPNFTIQFQWSPFQLEGYLRTWSAVQKFIKERNEDPVVKLFDQIESSLPNNFDVSFPLFLRIGSFAD